MDGSPFQEFSLFPEDNKNLGGTVAGLGVYFVVVSVRDERGREAISNSLPLALAPLGAPSAAANGAVTEITMTCAPPIRPSQTVALLVGRRSAPIESPATLADAVTAPFEGLGSGDFLPVRLRVDGVDSPVIDLTAKPPSLSTLEIP